MEGESATRTSVEVDLASAPGASRSQRWVGGGITLLVFMTYWSAWVLLIGFQPCAQSSLWWREACPPPAGGPRSAWRKGFFGESEQWWTPDNSVLFTRRWEVSHKTNSLNV
jgi:hypothetical protein